MPCVLTLICHRTTPLLTPSLLNRLGGVLDLSSARYLAENVAIEFLVPQQEANDIEGQVRQLLEGEAIDIVVQARDGRLKQLLIADMDSTIIEQECLDELADFAGRRHEVAMVTQAAMRGEIDFETALKQRVATLEGLPEDCLGKTLLERLSLTSGAHELVTTMNAYGAMTALVSGGFTYFTHRIAQAVGFCDNQGNILEIENGVLTGRIFDPILGQAAKRDALFTHCEGLNISVDGAIAVGDGANDLDMILAAGSGVAFHAKPAVAEAASIRIDHADLTALLFIQGICDTEFVS